jgi:hypothetical protein
MAALGFWIFVAAVVVAAALKKMNSEKVRHETLRLLIEKNQKLDEAQLKELLNPTPAPPPEWLIPRHSSGDGYRALRVCGTIVMFVALGLLIVLVWRGMMLGIYDRSVLDLGAGVALAGMVGIGLFVSSRFLIRPLDESRDKKGL